MISQKNSSSHFRRNRPKCSSKCKTRAVSENRQTSHQENVLALHSSQFYQTILYNYPRMPQTTIIYYIRQLSQTILDDYPRLSQKTFIECLRQLSWTILYNNLRQVSLTILNNYIRQVSSTTLDNLDYFKQIYQSRSILTYW